MKTQVTIVPASELSDIPEYDNHARVYKFENTDTGLRGYVAIHSERGILSTGGTRFYDYKTERDALRDALRLSSAMTAKCIVSGLPYGGAKGVIIGNPEKIKTTDLLHSYADVVESLEGRFRTGEDVGMTERDVQILIGRSKFFNGKSSIAGDPSPFAALSVYRVMSVLAPQYIPEKELSDCQMAIRGVGKVGKALVSLMHKEGADIWISDINGRAVEDTLNTFPGVQSVSNDMTPFLPVDIYAPCALGGEITEKDVSRYRMKIICGGANNQLADPGVARLLHARNILFVPDYLANAGGLINVSDELESDGFHEERVRERISALGDLASELFRESRERGVTLLEATDEYVRGNV